MHFKLNPPLQYRFGLPGKIELEYPKDRQGTQEKFHYTHYFRAQFDLTSINFNIDGYEYSVFDDYNGEEKPAVSSQGVSVTAPGKPKEVSFVCRAKPKADYSDLQAVLGNDQDQRLQAAYQHPAFLNSPTHTTSRHRFEPRSRGLPIVLLSPAVLRLGQEPRKLPRARFSGLARCGL